MNSSLTAHEIQLLNEEHARYLHERSKATIKVIDELFLEPLHFAAFGRKVCARRARKLRKRGDQVRFSHYTENNKVRYMWLPQPPRIVI